MPLSTQPLIIITAAELTRHYDWVTNFQSKAKQLEEFVAQQSSVASQLEAALAKLAAEGITVNPRRPAVKHLPFTSSRSSVREWKYHSSKYVSALQEQRVIS